MELLKNILGLIVIAMMLVAIFTIVIPLGAIFLAFFIFICLIMYVYTEWKDHHKEG